MNLLQKADVIQKILDSLFPNPKIPLIFESPYTLLIAVLLSAQSTDVRVNQCTPRLFSKAKTPQEMIKLSVHEIEEIIRPIGLAPTKARAILKLSHQLLDKHHGEVPSHFKDLEALAGVGHKTASVVRVQAFHLSAFPVDTHIHRCAKRWGLSLGTTVERTEKDLKRIFPENLWGRIHLQIIYFARTFCRARGHCIAQCPICKEIEGVE